MPPYRILLGVNNALGDKEGEYRVIKTALELFPESFLICAQYMWAITPRWGGSYEQMEEFSQQAEAYYDMNPELTVLCGFIYSDQANRLRRNEKYQQASKLYAEAIAYGDNFEFYHERAELYHYYLDKPDKALADFEKSIDHNPRHFESYRMIDDTLLQTKEWDRIISYWNAFLELEPEHAEAYLERSGTYYHKGDFTRSLEDLKQACDFGSKEGCKRYKQYRDKWK